MLLKEMFSPIGAPKTEEQEVDWLGDLKFFIDNDSDMLSNHFFPAIKKHEKYLNHPSAYKIYIRPLEMCAEEYCKKYQVENQHEKFPKESLIELAKHIANEQNQFIERGDYR